jgi:hypothetical protein
MRGTHNLHLSKGSSHITRAWREVHHRCAPKARIWVIAGDIRRFEAPRKEPGLDAIIFDLHCPDPTAETLTKCTSSSVDTASASVGIEHAIEIRTRCSRSAMILHSTWLSASVKTERIPVVIRHAFDNVDLGVPVLSIGAIVQEPAVFSQLLGKTIVAELYDAREERQREG